MSNAVNNQAQKSLVKEATCLLTFFNTATEEPIVLDRTKQADFKALASWFRKEFEIAADESRVFQPDEVKFLRNKSGDEAMRSKGLQQERGLSPAEALALDEIIADMNLVPNSTLVVYGSHDALTPEKRARIESCYTAVVAQARPGALIRNGENYPPMPVRNEDPCLILQGP